MRKEQTDQFLAGVTGSAYHRDFRLCAAGDSGLYIFLHNAQCVFRLARIATEL